MNKLSIIILVFTIFSCQSKQSSNTKTTSAKALQASIDLNEVEINTTKTCAFTIKNTGDIPLTIYNVKTSCGCTNAKWSKRPIKPGKSSEISIEFSDKYPGRFHKTVTVIGNLNDPLELNIQGRLVVPKVVQ